MKDRLPRPPPAADSTADARAGQRRATGPGDERGDQPRADQAPQRVDPPLVEGVEAAVLLISHRFSSVRSADRIYVLHHGEVVERGTHESLMAEGGRYATMFSLQASAYLGPDPTGG